MVSRDMGHMEYTSPISIFYYFVHNVKISHRKIVFNVQYHNSILHLQDNFEKSKIVEIAPRMLQLIISYIVPTCYSFCISIFCSVVYKTLNFGAHNIRGVTSFP